MADMPPATSAGRIRVEVVYALPGDVFSRELVLAEGATAADALAASQLAAAHPRAMADGQPAMGIFSRRVALDTRLRDGDRLEVYRPLTIDPKDARRRRAARTEPR
ncbi:MAG TPA: RnfH family protein [Rhodanobacteraceae bacterium]|nr:RnfH family protein [Rhodanobacteraceae bacterium]